MASITVSGRGGRGEHGVPFVGLWGEGGEGCGETEVKVCRVSGV